MRKERMRGQTQHQRAVERAHRLRPVERETALGRAVTAYEISAALYAELGSAREVTAEIGRRYGVAVTERTVSTWINRGLEAATLSESGGVPA